MARRFRRRTRRGFQGAGFPSRRPRPLEWITPIGRAEVLQYPADQTAMLVATANQVTAGTPPSDQMDIPYWPPFGEGNIITLTRLVGNIHIWARAPLVDTYWGVVRVGFQMVPWRSDAIATARLLFDADDTESKEWLYRTTMAPFGDNQYMTNGTSERFNPLRPGNTFDIKTQRRYDSSVYAIVMSIAWDPTIWNETGDIFWNVAARGLFRTGTGV